jgi:large subunit ribosomal protein L10
MVSEQKVRIVESLSKLIEESPVVGVVNMQNLPAKQLQTMKAMLRAKGVQIVMTRKRLIKRALERVSKDNISQLAEKLMGMPAVLLTKENPFALYSLLEKNKSPAPAKAGQTAPKDIVVKAGPTNFAPGPIISELGAVGIKTKVEGGKLVIINDVTVVKEGEVISQKVAETLKRLDIQPMEIGLDLRAVWENGLIFDAKQLHIDEEAFAADITQAASWAFNLAVEAAYPTADTIELLLVKVFTESKAVALEGNILTDATAEEIIGKVEREALALKEEAHVEVKTESPQEKTEEKPEKTEEAPAEEKKDAEPEQPAEEEQSMKEEAGEAPTEEEKHEDEPKEEEPSSQEEHTNGEIETEDEEEGKEDIPEVKERGKLEEEQPEKVVEEESLQSEEPSEEGSQEGSQLPSESPEEKKEEEQPEKESEETVIERQPDDESAVTETKESPTENCDGGNEQADGQKPDATVESENGKGVDEKSAQEKPASSTPKFHLLSQEQENISADELLKQAEEEDDSDDDIEMEEKNEVDTEIKEAEELFEKLKKQGILRDEQ